MRSQIHLHSPPGNFDTRIPFASNTIISDWKNVDSRKKSNYLLERSAVSISVRIINCLL